MIVNSLIDSTIKKLQESHDEFNTGSGFMDFEEESEADDWTVFIRYVRGEEPSSGFEGYIQESLMEEFSKLSIEQKNEIWRLATAEEIFSDEESYFEGLGIKKEDRAYYTYYDNELVKYYLYSQLERVAEGSWSDYENQ